MLVGKDALSHQNAYEGMFLCRKPRFCFLIKRKELTRTKASVYSKNSTMEVGHRVPVSGQATSPQAPEMPLRAAAGSLLAPHLSPEHQQDRCSQYVASQAMGPLPDFGRGEGNETAASP